MMTPLTRSELAEGGISKFHWSQQNYLKDGQPLAWKKNKFRCSDENGCKFATCENKCGF